MQKNLVRHLKGVLWPPSIPQYFARKIYLSSPVVIYEEDLIQVIDLYIHLSLSLYICICMLSHVILRLHGFNYCVCLILQQDTM